MQEKLPDGQRVSDHRDHVCARYANPAPLPPRKIIALSRAFFFTLHGLVLIFSLPMSGASGHGAVAWLSSVTFGPEGEPRSRDIVEALKPQPKALDSRFSVGLSPEESAQLGNIANHGS